MNFGLLAEKANDFLGNSLITLNYSNFMQSHLNYLIHRPGNCENQNITMMFYFLFTITLILVGNFLQSRLKEERERQN